MSVDSRPRKRAPVADAEAQRFLRKADPVLAKLIDARPDFRPRAWLDDLPPLDGFGTLVFQVAGQQLSSPRPARSSPPAGAVRRSHALAEELLAADPQVLRDSGFSARKGQTLRDARRALRRRTPERRGARAHDRRGGRGALTEVPGSGCGRARGFLLVALDRPDVFLTGDLALRRAIQRGYGFDHLPTEAEVAQVSDRWRPYRSLAVSYLFASEYEGGT
jgi:DNA-3-methyladenine glycosylase II